MKKTIYILIFLFNISIVSAEPSFLDMTSFSFKAEPGATYYGIDLGDRGDVISTAEVGAYADITIGGNVSLNTKPGFFTFDAYGRLPFTKTTGLMVDHDQNNTITDESFDVERHEYGLVLAFTPYFNKQFEWLNGLGGFLGYRFADTNIDGSSKKCTAPCGGSEDYKFWIHGPTIGLGYGQASKNGRHVINATGGLAYQFGKFELSNLPVSGSNIQNADLSGTEDALGYTLTTEYRYNFKDNPSVRSNYWTISLRLDAYYIDFGSVSYGSQSLSFTEWTASVRAGIRYTF